jgi:hypothetical protein
MPKLPEKLRGLRVRKGETVLGRVPILFLRKTEES